MLGGLGLGSGLGAGMGGAAGQIGTGLGGLAGLGKGAVNVMGSMGGNNPQPSAAQIPTQSEGGSTQQMDLDAMADHLEEIMRFAQGVKFYKTPPIYGPMSYNRAPANPNVGPGILGLQALAGYGGR